tara:strand:- start:280 stop:732 length:453 start_codon:yes stop_codon:yes gene_type:complete
MLVKIVDGSAQNYSLSQLKTDNPNTSFPVNMTADQLEGFDCYEAVYTEVPTINSATQKIVTSSVATLIDDVWTFAHSAENLSTDEKSVVDSNAAYGVREKRDALLAETDYLALSDNTLTDEMKTYRQSLRDITSLSSFPHLEDSDWPEKP